jgi:hypothetical protein
MLQNQGAALTGIGIGIGLMYFLDPERGRRRRALVRDKLTHTLNVTAEAAGTTGRDFAHRAAGTAAKVRNSFRRQPVDDLVLIERVRAQLGRVVSHPHAIDVKVADGQITLRGAVLQAEVNQLLRAVERVDGVREVVNRLEEHQERGNVPALQGGSTPRPPRLDIWQQQWAPTTRLFVGTAGAAAASYGASRRDVPGAILAAFGVGLIARAATNLHMRRLAGIGARRRSDLQRTLSLG